MSASKQPTAAASQFRLVQPMTASDGFTISWIDEIDGKTVEVRRATKIRDRRDATRMLTSLRRKAQRLAPRVEYSESRQLYVLHAYVDGKLVRRSLGTRDPSEIDRRKAIKLAELGLAQEADSFTVGDMLDRYWAEKFADKHPTRSRDCQRSLKLLRKHFTNNKQVRSITSDDYRAFIAWRSETVSAGSIRLELTYWNAALNLAAKAKRLSADALPPLATLPDVPEKERLVLTKDDWSAILDVAQNMRTGSARTGRLSAMEVYLHMVRYTGGRVSFYTQLKWSRVDFENRLIHFALVGEVATKKKRPTVPMNDQLEAILRRAYDEREPDTPGFDFVLWQRKNFQAQMSWLKSAMKKTGKIRLIELAERLHSHAFRRSFITWAVTAGWSPWLIGQVTGQSSAIIEKTYAVYQPDAAKSFMEGI